MRIFLLFIVSVFIYSCSSYKYLNIDALIPAKYSVQPEIKSVVVVNNAVPFRGDNVNTVLFNGKVRQLDSIWYDDFAKNVVLSLSDELMARHFFDTVYVEVSEKYPTGKEFSEADAKELCNRYNAEAVITLQKYFYRNWYDINQYDLVTVGSLDVSCVVLMTLYNNITHNMDISNIDKDTISWTSEGSNVPDIAKKLPGIKGGLEEMSYYIGGKSADLFAPYWESQKRGLYLSGNYSFMQAADLVRKNNWQEAMKLWKLVYDNSQKKTKERAAYNLALGSEIIGDFEGARNWIKECYEILKYLPDNSFYFQDKWRMKEYYTEIEKRASQAKMLKKQVGGGL